MVHEPAAKLPPTWPSSSLKVASKVSYAPGHDGMMWLIETTLEIAAMRLISRTFGGRLLIALAACVGVLAMAAAPANAAGCSYHADPQPFNLPDGYGRSYEGGRFYHYKIVTAPCNGPECRPSNSDSMAAIMVASTNLRQSSLSHDLPAVVMINHAACEFLLEAACIYSPPLFAPLLRPPSRHLNSSIVSGDYALPGLSS